MSLVRDMWFYIASKLDSAGDRIRFRAVCKPWRSLLPFRQPPWLMLAQDEAAKPYNQQHHNSEDASELESEPFWMTVLGSSSEEELLLPPPPPLRGFVSLTDQKPYHIDFPELDGARTIGSTGSWLITMHLDETLRVLNPFTRQQLYLPPATRFRNRDDLEGLSPKEYRDHVLVKVVLSSPPSGNDDWVAIAVHHYTRDLAVARPGDTGWLTIQESFCTEDVVFYKGRLYAINFVGRLIVCDLGGVDPPKASYLTDTIPFLQKVIPYRKHYLVEWSGELLYVRKYLDHIRDPVGYKTNRFEVHKFDFTTMKFMELESLGEHSLFLGYNTSVSVRASDYYGLVKKNCIYFTDDYELGYLGKHILGGHDMGVYNLEDKSITPHYKGTSTSWYSPPVWVVPT